MLETSLQKSLLSSTEFEQQLQEANKVLSDQEASIAKLSNEVKQKNKKISDQTKKLKKNQQARESKNEQHRQELDELNKQLSMERKLCQIEIDANKKYNEDNLSIISEQCSEINNLKTEVESLETRLVNECLESGSRQAHVAQLKQKIADMTESSEAIAELNTQLSKKTNVIASLKTEIEAKKKKIESLASKNTVLQNTKAKLLTRMKNQHVSHQEEIKKHEVRLDMALNTGQVDVVSVHLVAEIYKLYKEKAELLEKSTEIQTCSPSVSFIDKTHNAQVLTGVDSKQEDENTTPTQVTRSFDCSSCGKTIRMNNRIIFYPCCHGACKSCASKLTVCYICQTPIQSKEKQFK